MLRQCFCIERSTENLPAEKFEARSSSASEAGTQFAQSRSDQETTVCSTGGEIGLSRLHLRLASKTHMPESTHVRPVWGQDGVSDGPCWKVILNRLICSDPRRS
jgi:hypothetical protein